MMRQYHEAKAACGDALLFFRMGDFYELFLDDAKVAAKILGLNLTSRDKDSDNPTAMAGFPHHQLDAYQIHHKLFHLPRNPFPQLNLFYLEYFFFLLNL